ncbi:MAG: glycosyltransferase family 1 protein [SAR202 cluster bacterium]|nr:glycosyltransferase family 1 protein [SAR202 cluster bacterium]
MGSFDSVIFIYAPTWDAASQVSKHHMARYWAAQGKRVLYVEAPFHAFSLFTRLREVQRLWRRYTNGPQEVTPNLWVAAVPILFPYRAGWPLAGFGPVLSVNQLLVRRRLRQVQKRFGLSNPLLVVGSAIANPFIDALGPSLVLYHCSDDYTRSPTFPSSYTKLEKSLTARADLVICTAETLRQVKASLNSYTYTVVNGAQVGHFAHTQDPQVRAAADLQGLPKPVIGYIGTVFEWIDQEMIAFAAKAHPEWSFVLVGPIATDVSRLRPLRNVHLVGPRPYTDLPAYLKGFDVATVPFVFHDVTLRASPVKFYEYLASGVPVVATKLPDFEPLGHMTELVSSPQEFTDALERAIRTETSEKQAARMREAKNHSWEARFAQVDGLIAEAYARRGRKLAVQPQGVRA